MERLRIYWSVCEFTGASESQPGFLKFWWSIWDFWERLWNVRYQKNASWKKRSLKYAPTGSGCEVDQKKNLHFEPDSSNCKGLKYCQWWDFLQNCMSAQKLEIRDIWALKYCPTWDRLPEMGPMASWLPAMAINKKERPSEVWKSPNDPPITILPDIAVGSQRWQSMRRDEAALQSEVR